MHNLKLRTIYIITQNVLAPKKLIHSRNSKNTTPNLQGLEILEAIVFFYLEHGSNWFRVHGIDPLNL